MSLRPSDVTDLIQRLRDRANALPAELSERENVDSSHCGPYGSSTPEEFMDDPDVLLLHDAADALETMMK